MAGGIEKITSPYVLNSRPWAITIVMAVAIMIVFFLVVSIGLWVWFMHTNKQLANQRIENDIGPYPLYYDKNGVYITDISVDGQPVTAVVDTGSAHLLVAGTNCGSCLKNVQNGYVSPKQKPKFVNDVIQYGSQKDVVDWYDGDVSMGPSHRSVGAEFALVQKRSGSSSYNVLGVGIVNYFKSMGRKNFMSYFSPSNIVTFEVRGREGKLWLGGNRDKHPPAQFVTKMLDPPFFRAELADLRCGNKQVPKALFPTHGVIFDTGSNMLDLPGTLFSFLAPSLEDNQPIDFVFAPWNAACQGRAIRIRYFSDQYKWQDKKLLVVSGSDNRHIVLGSLFMNYLRLTFDPKNKTIGMSVL